jgi:AGZA family xanthine/uracil permease-like MFS transporter
MTGVAPVGEKPAMDLAFHLPIPVIGDFIEALTSGYALQFVSVIVPMGVFNVLGSLQNIESAEAAGDAFPTKPSLAVNGLGTMLAALFGSCFPTTIYIGHPGWKGLGARAGYSVLNAVFVTGLCLSGALAIVAWAVPVDAGMAIVIWIGVVITAQAFQTIPKAHAPAAVIGILPGVAAWGTMMAKNGLRAAGVGTTGGEPFSPALIDSFRMTSDTWIHGAFALEQGFIFTSMILAAATVHIIQREFRLAAMWCVIASGLSAVGFIHSYAWTFGDTVLSLEPALPWAAGYGLMASLLLLAPYITEPGEGHCGEGH